MPSAPVIVDGRSKIRTAEVLRHVDAQNLRDAAGQMIESVVKSILRKEDMGGTYMDTLFEKMNSMYHLDQTDLSAESGKKDLGPLPQTAVILLGTLAVTWVLIIAYVLAGMLRKKRH